MRPPVLAQLAADTVEWLCEDYLRMKPRERAALAPPPLFEDGASAEDWRTRRPALLEALAEHVYGPAPAPIEPVVRARVDIAPEDAGGVGGVRQFEIELGAAGRFHLVLARPPGTAPVPTILAMNFCGNRAAFPGRPRAIAPPLHFLHCFCRHAAFDPASRLIFGTHINEPPFELIAARGYALALFFGGDIVPDHAPDARGALARFATPETGALSAWAWVFSRVVDVLEREDGLDPTRMIAWGQSRQGKAALLAGARDERIAAVVGVQAGRGGDALTRHREGESVDHVAKTYPHWFSPRFASYAASAPPVDQHQLLALIAPRPLLIGHARRDGWADPVGAHAALEAARPAWDLFGAPPPRAFVRAGGHGIRRDDWRATLDFLDARL